jgi:hypothetical protein
VSGQYEAKKETTTMNKKKSGVKKINGEDSPSKADWRSNMLARIRTLIREADPEAVEEVKWRKPSDPAGVPVWSRDGIICTGETYKNAVKMTFAKGAALADPSGLFNSSLEGNTRRAIDFHEGDKINEKALKALIRAAVALNTSAAGSVEPRRARASARSVPAKKSPKNTRGGLRQSK